MSVFRKLRIQLTMVCVAVTGIVLVGMAGAASYFSIRQLDTQYDAHFASSVSAVHYVIRSQPVISHAWLRETEAKEGVLVDVRSAEYTLLFPSVSEEREALLSQALDLARQNGVLFEIPASVSGSVPQAVPFDLVTSTGRYRAAVTVIATEHGDLAVSVLQSRAAQQRQVNCLLLQYIGCVAVSVVCLLGFGWVFTGFTVRPVEESRKKQTEFVSAASHELRSPLAVIQICAEKLGDATPARVRQYGETIHGECERLSRLAGDLLQLAGADNHSWKINLSLSNPDAVVLNTVERFEQLARSKGISLRAVLPEGPLVYIACDRQRLEQALIALVDNAMRFTPAAGTIEVAARREKGWLLLTVSDSGPGVPEHQRKAVFERFYQGDASRTDQEHFGLGLAIVQEIVRRHGGDVRVGESRFGGAAFVIRLPLALDKQRGGY